VKRGLLGVFILLKLDHVNAAPGIELVKVAGEIDAHTFEELEEFLEELMDKGHTRLVLDMTKTTYISSAGFGILVETAGQTEGETGGSLVLFGLTDAVQHVFDQMGFTPMFKITKTKDEALAMSATKPS